MVRLAPDPPALLLAGHLDGDSPVLVYRVESLDQTVSKLARSGIEVRARFEIPHGPGVELRGAGPQRVAVYQVVRRTWPTVSTAGAISSRAAPTVRSRRRQRSGATRGRPSTKRNRRRRSPRPGQSSSSGTLPLRMERGSSAMPFQGGGGIPRDAASAGRAFSGHRGDRHLRRAAVRAPVDRRHPLLQPQRQHPRTCRSTPAPRSPLGQPPPPTWSCGGVRPVLRLLADAGGPGRVEPDAPGRVTSPPAASARNRNI